MSRLDRGRAGHGAFGGERKLCAHRSKEREKGSLIMAIEACERSGLWFKGLCVAFRMVFNEALTKNLNLTSSSVDIPSITPHPINCTLIIWPIAHTPSLV